MIKEYFLNYEALTNDVTVQLGARHELEFHGSHTEQDYRVTLADTGDETMTGGRIARIKRFVKDDTFMLTYGDSVGDLNIGKLLAFHNSHGGLATVTTVRPPSRFGSLALGHGAKVASFNEKPRLGDWISAGFFVLNRGVFDYLGGDDCVWEQAPLERLAADHELHAYRHDGSWYPMDTYRETVMLNDMWREGTAAWRVWK
jgi:glucose-1-phosphate cytidylyltransferase